MKKISGETKLLLIMGLVVLLGGGYLAFNPPDRDADPAAASSPNAEPTPKPMDVATFEKLWKESTHRKEASGADITVIEFADVECSSCRYAYQKLTKDFGKTIPISLAFRHYPLEGHQSARPCAQALEAAHRQGKFWELYTALFTEEQPLLSQEYILDKAREAGLDMARFDKDVKDPAIAAPVEADVKLGQERTVLRTPTFFILNKKTNSVSVAIGGREALEKLQGVPGVPTPEPAKKK